MTITRVAQSGASTAWMAGAARDYLAGTDADIVVVLGGVNDGNGRASATIDHLSAIYSAAQSRGARVIAITELPWRGYSRWLQAAQDRQDQVRQWQLAGADGLADVVVDARPAFEDQARPGYLNPLYDSGDHLHPNAAGQRRLAQLVAAHL